MRTPAADDPHVPLAVSDVAELLRDAPARWWLSGGVALDHWLGRQIRERPNIDVSTTPQDLAALVAHLPGRYRAWAPRGEDLIPWDAAPVAADLQPVRIRDGGADAFVLQVNVEDESPRGWVYRRDPRLQLPWERAVLDVDGIPTGAPEVQLVWKALRPRPEDELDKDAVLAELSPEAREWWERAILSIHPHSTWAIHVRSPMFPAKASWNRPQH